MVAKINFCITGHGEKVAHELNHQDNCYFTAVLTWQGNTYMGHKHGRFFKRFQDAFQVIAIIGTNMLIKAPMETGVRVIIRFKY